MTVESDSDRATMLADFGETFRVSPGPVWPNKSDKAADITAIFDSEYLAVFGDGTETASNNPVAFARASDLVDVVRNSVMVRASDQAAYKVVRIQPDGTGMTIIELEGPR